MTRWFAGCTGFCPADPELRTLQRRLSEENISYRKLLQEERCGIAAEPGYSQQAHFTQAFKGWTSMTPSQYRALADSVKTNLRPARGA